jgi:hypothetical protein
MFNKKFIAILVVLSVMIGGLVYWDFLSLTKNTVTKIVFPHQSVSQSLVPIEEVKVNSYRLKRLAEKKGLSDATSTDKYINQLVQINKQPEQISNYQAFVTVKDEAVKERAKNKSFVEIYNEALKWVWVEDGILNGAVDKWLLPEVFLNQTPSWSTNPVLGQSVSDCEEQAYTLVAILRAAGMNAEKVRVATGKVNFAGAIGGHAWVEIYDDENKNWFQLEPSSGNYYDSETKTFVPVEGLPFAYFKTHQYPALEIWVYFNDQYFWDNNHQQGVRPSIWEKNIPNLTITLLSPTFSLIPTPTLITFPSTPFSTTDSANIITQPPLSNLQMQQGMLTLINYLQTKKEKKSFKLLVDFLTAEINQSLILNQSQKEALLKLITTISDFYESNNFSLTDLDNLHKDLTAIFSSTNIIVTPSVTDSLTSPTPIPTPSSFPFLKRIQFWQKQKKAPPALPSLTPTSVLEKQETAPSALP